LLGDIGGLEEHHPLAVVGSLLAGQRSQQGPGRIGDQRPAKRIGRGKGDDLGRSVPAQRAQRFRGCFRTLGRIGPAGIGPKLGHESQCREPLLRGRIAGDQQRL
jgi:hypothetical protein